MASGRYNLRDSVGRNYRELCSVKLPRASKVAGKLYPIEVVEQDGSRVRIHYVGYDESTDEWRELADIVHLSTENDAETDHQSATEVNVQTIQSYNLYNELRVKIKQSLVCGRKQCPSVIIDIGFDLLLFKGGLEAAGKSKGVSRGNLHYQIAQYSDLDILLGPKWHYRGINEQGDYAFVILDSIDYYISKRRKITEYYPSEGGVPVLHQVDAGYSLHFSFVRGYGNSTTFGKNKDIFGQ